MFLVQLAEGSFPHVKARDNAAELEEERRLFFVGITRCQRELYLVHPMLERRWKDAFLQPSRFLREIDEALIETWDVLPSNEDVLWY